MTIRSIQELGIQPVVFCKNYHKGRVWLPDGKPRSQTSEKSRCPVWAEKEVVQRVLIESAVFSENGGKDCQGRPKKIWNAVNGCIFVGISNQVPEPVYNCMIADFPESNVREKVLELARRAIDDIGSGHDEI